MVIIFNNFQPSYTIHFVRIAAFLLGMFLIPRGILGSCGFFLLRGYSSASRGFLLLFRGYSPASRGFSLLFRGYSPIPRGFSLLFRGYSSIPRGFSLLRGFSPTSRGFPLLFRRYSPASRGFSLLFRGYSPTSRGSSLLFRLVFIIFYQKLFAINMWWVSCILLKFLNIITNCAKACCCSNGCD